MACAIQHSRRQELLASPYPRNSSKTTTAAKTAQDACCAGTCWAPQSQQVRRVNFMIMQTGTSARCTTTRSKPDAAAAISPPEHQNRGSSIPLVICSASATGISTGSGVHMPALTREESSRELLPPASQFCSTWPATKGTDQSQIVQNCGSGRMQNKRKRGSACIRDDFDQL
jgi:hypothetical protein